MMSELSRQIAQMVRSEANRRLLQSRQQFKPPEDDDQFDVLLRKLDAAEQATA